MTMHAPDHLRRGLDLLPQESYFFSEFLRQGIADRVRHIEGRGPGLDGRLQGLGQKTGFWTGRRPRPKTRYSGCSGGRNRSPSRINSSTSRSVLRSLYFKWRSEVAIKICSRGSAAVLMASQARSISPFWVRARAATVNPRTSLEIRLTASKSPWEATGNPASITSTFNFSNWRARRNFSALFMLAPGDCSPSRRVVSK